jgi:hypothetical protein
VAALLPSPGHARADLGDMDPARAAALMSR